MSKFPIIFGVCVFVFCALLSMTGIERIDGPARSYAVLAWFCGVIGGMGAGIAMFASQQTEKR